MEHSKELPPTGSSPRFLRENGVPGARHSLLRVGLSLCCHGGEDLIGSPGSQPPPEQGGLERLLQGKRP